MEVNKPYFDIYRPWSVDYAATEQGCYSVAELPKITRTTPKCASKCLLYSGLVSWIATLWELQAKPEKAPPIFPLTLYLTHCNGEHFCFGGQCDGKILIWSHHQRLSAAICLLDSPN